MTMAGFQKGHKKIGGRVAGKPSAGTDAVRSVWKDVLSNNMDRIQQSLDCLEPKDYIAALINISKIVLPNQQAISLDGNITTKEKTIEDELLELSKMG